MISIILTQRQNKLWNRRKDLTQSTIPVNSSMILIPNMSSWKTLVILSLKCFLMMKFKTMNNTWSKKMTNTSVNWTKLIFIARSASLNKVFPRCLQQWTSTLAKSQVILKFCKKKVEIKFNQIFKNFSKFTMSWENNLSVSWLRKKRWIRILFKFDFYH